MSAFQFYAIPDGLALTTSGFVYGWIGYTTLPIAQYVTPVGLAIHGLAVSQADFWHYTETISDANWTDVDL